MTLDATAMVLIVGLTAMIVHNLHLTFGSNKTLTRVDELIQPFVDELRRLFPQVTIPPSMPQAPAAVPLASTAGKVASLAILIAMMGCGATARQDTLSAAVATVTSTEQAMIAYDKVHQTEIASDTELSTEQRHNALTAYRATRDKVEIVVDAAWRALGIAGPLTDDLSLVGVQQALTNLAIAFRNFTGSH